MRILYHHRTFGDGAEGIHIRSIVAALRALGHAVLVVAPDPPREPGARASRGWLERVGPWLRSRGRAYDVAQMLYCGRSVAQVSRAVRAFRPDVIYERYANYNYAGVIAGRRYGIPVLLEMNCPYSDTRERYDEPVHFPALRRRIERDICRRADTVIAVSSPIKQFLDDVGVPPAHVVVMPNGVDLDLFRPAEPDPAFRAAHGLTGKTVVGFAGILRPWHGVDLLIEAFETVAARFPHAHLLIVGDGPHRSTIEAAVHARGLQSRVTITGRQPHDRMRRFIGVMDIAVSPRATRYASPMKLVEYMAMGKAIVAPDMPNIRDLLVADTTGVLCPPERADALGAALQSLIADPARRQRLGSAARAAVEGGRSWTANARSVITIAEICARQKNTQRIAGH